MSLVFTLSLAEYEGPFPELRTHCDLERLELYN